MKIYLVVNESPWWGDDRQTDSVWLTKRQANIRLAKLNTENHYYYTWALEWHTVKGTKRVD